MTKTTAARSTASPTMEAFRSGPLALATAILVLLVPTLALLLPARRAAVEAPTGVR